MISLKGLAIVALLVGGTSLAMAQNGPPGPGVNPAPNYGQSAAPTTGASTTTRVAHHPTSRNRRMYMQGDVHRGTKVTGSALSTNKFRHNKNSYK